MTSRRWTMAASRRDLGAGPDCENGPRMGHSAVAERTVCAIAAVVALTLLAAPVVGVRPAAAQVIPK
jgi:hypothetical protein